MTTRERLCRVCPVYGQRAAYYETPHVCDACQARMARQLVSIGDQWLLLDATPATGHTERVSGSHEAPLGVRADVLDQLLPVTGLSAETIRDPYRDQTGDTPAAVVLDAIATEWVEARRRGGHREHRPVPTVTNLTGWLRDRLDWACTYLPDAIDTHADEIRRLCGRLHALNGSTTSRDPEPLPGIPCRQCGHIALVKIDRQTICTNCSQYSGPIADAITTAIATMTEQAA